MKKTWKKLDSKIVYQTQWMNLREDRVITPNGSEGIYNYIENPRGSAVFVVALTEKQEVYLIHQYRYPTQQFSWEVPGGSSDHQSIQKAAQRELQEETGVLAHSFKHLSSFQSLNGVSSEISHVVLATDLKETEDHNKEEEGIREVKQIPFSEVIAMVKNGEITDSQSINVLFLAALHLGIPINFPQG